MLCASTTSVCCATTVGASSCAFVWNIVTLLAVSALLTFDIIFILDPTTCILTPTCATQPQVISLNSIIQLIPPFKNYTASDSKKLLLEIQAGAAGKNGTIASPHATSNGFTFRCGLHHLCPLHHHFSRMQSQVTPTRRQRSLDTGMESPCSSSYHWHRPSRTHRDPSSVNPTANIVSPRLL